MKRTSLLFNYKLIYVNTIPHMILRTQMVKYGNGRRSFAKLGSLVWNLIPVFEFIKVDLRSEGGKMEKGPKPPLSIFRGGGFGLVEQNDEQNLKFYELKNRLKIT